MGFSVVPARSGTDRIESAGEPSFQRFRTLDGDLVLPGRNNRASRQNGETPRRTPPISARRVRETWGVRRSDPRRFPLSSGQIGHSSGPAFRIFGFFHLPLWSRVPEPIAPEFAIGALTDHQTCGILNNMDHVRPSPTGNYGCEPRGCAACGRARHSDFGTRPELAGGHGDRRGRRGQKWSPSAKSCHNSRQVRPCSQPAPPRTHAESGRPAGQE